MARNKKDAEYSDLYRVKESKSACTKQYETAYKCLSKHILDHENAGDAEGVCTRALEVFTKCTQ